MSGLPAMPGAVGWRAELALELERRGDTTRLVGRRASGPLAVQKPLYPEAPEVCHIYLLHPPGGVAGGDSLRISCSVAPAARALLTTPASGKFYRSSGGRTASQRQLLRVASGASLEWLPQDNIFFGGSDVRMETRVDLDDGAGFIGWEINCLGRPASGDHYQRGRLVQQLALWRGDRPLLLDCFRIAAGAPMLAAPWGLAGYTVSGALYAVAADDEHVALAREELAHSGLERAAATRVGDVLVVRCLSSDAELCRHSLGQLWQRLRPALLGRDACAPRIWRT